MNEQIKAARDIITGYKGRPIRIMEVCGTHTHEIFRLGIRKLLPENIDVISGPGCPVCVTAVGYIDEACWLALEKNCIICTFGDLIKVPGTEMSLAGARAKGAQVRPVYSPLDAVELAKSNELPELDVAYLDPPYNQHPYGSNYFMLNLILKNKLDVEISEVSGITQDWNRSEFNKALTALSSLEQIVANLKAKYIIISYNSEGFITFEQMKSMLSKYGKLESVEIEYNTFRGSRNLNARSLHVSEYLFVLKK